MLRFLILLAPAAAKIKACISDVDVVLSPSGFASISPVVDGVRWQVVGRRVLCAGVGSVPCHGTGRVSCLGPADGFAFGTLTIVGGPVYCIKVWDPQINGFQTICNNTSINVEIDGTWAGTWALRGDTGSSMALKLANAINNHSVLKTKVVAAASGNEVLVRARTAGVDFTYPWYTTCSFNTEYFTQCAFEAKRSPNATLGM